MTHCFSLDPKIYTCRNTGYCRKKSSFSVHICPNPTKKIPKHLSTSNFEKQGGCVWLSMALLLHFCGQKDIASQMSEVKKKYPELCDWQMAQGLKLDYFGTNVELKKITVQEQLLKRCIELNETKELVVGKLGAVPLFQTFFPNLNQYKWKIIKMRLCGYDANGKSTWQPEQFLDYLRENKGYYVGFLCSRTEESFHAIAIDSINDRVYDCEEDFQFYLNLDVLNLCCGEKKKFTKFSSLYKLNIEI